MVNDILTKRQREVIVRMAKGHSLRSGPNNTFFLDDRVSLTKVHPNIVNVLHTKRYIKKSIMSSWWYPTEKGFQRAKLWANL